MTLTTLTHGEPWMTPHERDLNQELIRDFATHLENAGVPQSALSTLRINDIVATWLLARRLESALAPADGEPAPCPTTAQANAIGKCRDRLRKAIKELEEYCARNGAPAHRGLVDQMHDAVQIAEASGFPTDVATRINPVTAQQTESQPTAPTGDPNPPKNAPETPANPNPVINTVVNPANPNPVINTVVNPANPNPAISAAVNPGSPQPAANHPGDRRQFNTPSERRKSRREHRDKYHTRKAVRIASDTCHDTYTALIVPPVPPPKDTG